MKPDVLNENTEARFSELAAQYQTKLPRKLAQLLPLKTRIEELRAKKASYDTIRILLAEVNIIVSNDTVYRFCRDVIGHKTSRQHNQNGSSLRTKMANGSLRFTDATKPQQPPEPIQENLPKKTERTSAPWIPPQKRGPRIADSKNL